MKTTLTLLILLTVFSINTSAQDFPPHTVLEQRIEATLFDILFSPDGKTIAGVSEIEREIYLWDVSTGTRKAVIEGVNGSFSPDGKTLATTGYDDEIRLWDVSTGTRKAVIEGVNGSFSPDGKTLATTGYDDEIRLWNVSTGTRKGTFEEDSDSVSFSPDGKTLASKEWISPIHLLDVSTGTRKVTLEESKETNPNMLFSPDGKTLASAYHDEIHLWDVDTGTHKATLEGHTGRVFNISFTRDGRTLASESFDGIRLWDVKIGAPKATLEGNRASFSPDGLTLVSGGAGIIRLWDAETGALKATIETPTEPITSRPPGIPPIIPGSVYTYASFSPDGKTLASATIWDEGRGSTALWSTLDLWDVDTRAHKTTLGEFWKTGISGVFFSPDGRTLAVIMHDTDFQSFSFFTIHLWRLSTEVRITPSPIRSPSIGEQLSVDISIVNGKNVGGYQISVDFDETALRYVESANADYLPPGAFAVPPDVSDGKITFAATSLTGTRNGDGTLATLMFEVVDIKESILALSNVILTDSHGEHLPYHVFNGLVTGSIFGDVNTDGVVNILDLVQVASLFNQRENIEKADLNEDGIINIVDLVKVAGALGGGGAAPSLQPQALAMFTAADVQKWLAQAQGLNLTDATSQQGILFLEYLLAALIPKETILLPNYPNPFNPETWIPYQLAESADVTLTIYAVDGTVVRTLELGHQPVGIYQDKGRAAYWDGRNEVGEPVASGVYFYTLSAGNFTATRKMLIEK